MKWSLMQLELGVLVLALGVLLLDLWVPAENRRKLGFVAADFGVREYRWRRR